MCLPLDYTCTNAVRNERLSIWVNVVTDVAKLLRIFFPGTHISLFQILMWYHSQIVDDFVKNRMR